MKRSLIHSIFFLALAFGLKAQERKQGTVSYVSAQNIYLRFESTAGLREGDTLYTKEGGQACLRIAKISSISCLAQKIGNCEIAKGDLYYLVVEKEPDPIAEEPAIAQGPRGETIENASDSLSMAQTGDLAPAMRVRKRHYVDFGLSNGTTISSTRQSNYRSNLRTRLYVDSLLGRPLSLEAYGVFQDFRRSYESEADAFRANLYNLALTYRPNEHHQIVLGRKINRRVASLGAIDGLQWEGQWNKFRVGAIAGSRPDFVNFGFNPQLLQYGAYAAYDWRKNKSFGQLSLGLMEQQNGGATDRRYLYTQQNFRYQRLSLFASAEVDLFENFDTATAQNTFKLSSLYLSARYRASDRWNLFLSYDTRQQIIFFERFDSEVERLLAEQGAREGWRIRSDFRFFKSTHLGLSYNLRTNPTFGNRSQNLQASLVQYRLPWIGGNLAYRFNLNQNGNLNSEINSLRYSRNSRSNFRFSLYYRYASYQYALREITLDPQHFYGLELSKTFDNNLNLGLNAEYSQINNQDLIRVYFRINKRLHF